MGGTASPDPRGDTQAYQGLEVGVDGRAGNLELLLTDFAGERFALGQHCGHVELRQKYCYPGGV